MFSLCFLLYSLDRDILHARKIMGFFKILITHKSTRSENAITWRTRLEESALTFRLPETAKERIKDTRSHVV